MNKFTRQTAFVFVSLLVVVLVIGCGKKTEATGSAAPEKAATETAPASAAKLSAAAGIHAAIDKKDYNGAVQALAGLKQAITTDAQKVEFANLVDEVRIKLIDEAPNDPKAAQALAAVRAISGGR